MTNIQPNVRQRPASARTRRAGAQIGEHLTTWRKLQGLTAQQVAERAGIARSTLSRLEHGQTGVSLETLLDVLRALGQVERVLNALDPYETDLGRARADMTLPARVRHG